jgi:hypothetical protein
MPVQRQAVGCAEEHQQGDGEEGAAVGGHAAPVRSGAEEAA